MKSFMTMMPNGPICFSSPPLDSSSFSFFDVPDRKLAAVSVETRTTLGTPDNELSISVLALDGGAISPSHTGSPGNRLAATLPSTA